MRKKIIQSIVALATTLGLIMPQWAIAQGDQSELSLTITPPLIQLSLAPGQTWSSTLKVVNSNQYELSLYASMALLEANGDEGQSKFTPILDGAEGSTLANWVKLNQTTFKVSQEKSYELPFTITVPEDAPPGGHYAAIVVGSQPLSGTPDGASLSISSSITSLLFLRVAGDVIEKGGIREFTTEENFYGRPTVKFLLRFENQGNVHIQPQGEIVITNMWGKQRGRIPINQKTRFGNVLPESVRKFEFEWKGEWNPLEFGRYKAQAVLAYGTEQKESVASTDYFWVIPVKETIAFVGGFVIFILALLWAIRRYIRRSLAIEAQRFAPVPKTTRKTKTPAKTASPARKRVSAAATQPEANFFTRFIVKLKSTPILTVAIAVIALGVIGIFIFFVQVLKSERDFEVEVIKPDNKNFIIKDESQEEPKQIENAQDTQSAAPTSATVEVAVPVVVLNGTATTGLGGKVASDLREQKVTVSKVGNAARQPQTTIVFHPDDKKSAENLNSLLDSPAKLVDSATSPGIVTLTVGNDY